MSLLRPALLMALLFASTVAQEVMVASDLEQDQQVEGQGACPDVQPQRSLDLEQVMGTWYVVEAVSHHATGTGRQGQLGSPKGHLTCAVFHLELFNDTTVYLEWEQQPPYPVLEYYMSLQDSPGWWEAITTPWSWAEGTAREQVQVMKAVGDHLALTFCQPGAGGHVFTAVLGRRNQLTLAQLRGVNGMLQRRGLDVIHTRQMEPTLCQQHRSWTLGRPGGERTTSAGARPSDALAAYLLSLIIFPWTACR